jgi:hypothetical protein
MRPLTGYVTPYLLISDLFKNINSMAVVTEIIHRRLFGRCYHLFEPTVQDGFQEDELIISRPENVTGMEDRLDNLLLRVTPQMSFCS